MRKSRPAGKTQKFLSIALLLPAVALACASGEDMIETDSSEIENCGPACTGCCQNGVCFPGTSELACGSNGMTCSACSNGESCFGGSCESESCGPSNCANGCCSNDVCMNGTSTAACGSGGGLCDVCESGAACEGKQCTAEACPGGKCDNPVGTGTGVYQVVLASAVFNPIKASGDDWDGPTDSGCLSCWVGCCPPDPYASPASHFAGMPIPHMVGANTTTPMWNIVIGEKPEAGLVGATVTIVMNDEDPGGFWNDDLGGCNTAITQADLAAGQITLNPSRGCTGAIQSVTFLLNKS